MTKIIGLTGGIGSGKTTIASFFKALGIPVYNADYEAEKISQTPEVIHQIQTSFGIHVFENGKLNRQKLAKIVFSDPEKLKQLNSIVHPAVKNHFQNWLLKYSDSHYVIKEAAILFETGSYIECDLLITIVAPEDVKIKRVMQRDKITRDDVLKRMKNQWTDVKKIEKSHYVIENGSLIVVERLIRANVKKLIIQ